MLRPVGRAARRQRCPQRGSRLHSLASACGFALVRRPSPSHISCRAVASRAHVCFRERIPARWRGGGRRSDRCRRRQRRPRSRLPAHHQGPRDSLTRGPPGHPPLRRHGHLPQDRFVWLARYDTCRRYSDHGHLSPNAYEQRLRSTQARHVINNRVPAFAGKGRPCEGPIPLALADPIALAEWGMIPAALACTEMAEIAARRGVCLIPENWRPSDAKKPPALSLFAARRGLLCIVGPSGGRHLRRRCVITCQANSASPLSTR